VTLELREPLTSLRERLPGLAPLALQSVNLRGGLVADLDKSGELDGCIHRHTLTLHRR
jgi:hypothetical protein